MLLGGHVLYAVTGLWVSVAVASALLVQELTGTGQIVTIDVQQCLEVINEQAIQAYARAGRRTDRRGPRGAITSVSGAFQCADGWWMLSVPSGAERWSRFLDWVQDPVLAADPSLAEEEHRVHGRERGRAEPDGVGRDPAAEQPDEHDRARADEREEDPLLFHRMRAEACRQRQQRGEQRRILRSRSMDMEQQVVERSDVTAATREVLSDQVIGTRIAERRYLRRDHEDERDADPERNQCDSGERESEARPCEVVPLSIGHSRRSYSPFRAQLLGGKVTVTGHFRAQLLGGKVTVAGHFRAQLLGWSEL